MASPDARYISSAITAARNLLSLTTELDPRMIMCYLPSRYHLYGLYAAVFLYKALIQGLSEARLSGTKWETWHRPSY
ncbi:hypothetical protein BDP81DRAFT_171287 [Colletotrichum phormii]|uniref:Uncharacterized protein n=1 Tax=Colletotrichum phormii TaxID=359342 RepID=A0AAI9ZEB5_9PEZI|nr:uncharacterized protein BDP81DRAFT_171287 [Colletotrichum phormii]KAK1621834.1 hypothetical protein BDP81DRAFT_171287 [Colletotrichum phormii]